MSLWSLDRNKWADNIDHGANCLCLVYAITHGHNKKLFTLVLSTQPVLCFLKEYFPLHMYCIAVQFNAMHLLYSDTK